ncbi:MAG: hypothetical protein ABSC55_18155 [Syntrophorhabdales bacterium]|jgi:hypothetical protein
MPTNRHKRTRTRRDSVTDEYSRFFLDGTLEQGGDVLWDLFSDLGKIFRLWVECKDSLHRQYRRCLAWRVFELGTAPYIGFTWVNQKQYIEWIVTNHVR